MKIVTHILLKFIKIVTIEYFLNQVITVFDMWLRVKLVMIVEFNKLQMPTT